MKSDPKIPVEDTRKFGSGYVLTIIPREGGYVKDGFLSENITEFKFELDLIDISDGERKWRGKVEYETSVYNFNLSYEKAIKGLSIFMVEKMQEEGIFK